MPKGVVLIERDRGWRKIKRAVEMLEGQNVKVGIRAGKSNGGVEVIDYAVWNEFGTDDGRVPSRPFMRRTADVHENSVRRYVRSLVGGLVSGQMDPATLLNAVGVFWTDKTKEMIRKAGSWAKPNAPATIAAKKSSKPLIDDGVLINTVDYEIKRGR